MGCCQTEKHKKRAVYETVGGARGGISAPAFKDGHEFSESVILRVQRQDRQTYVGSLVRSVTSWAPYRTYQVKVSEDGVRKSFLTSVHIIFMLTL